MTNKNFQKVHEKVKKASPATQFCKISIKNNYTEEDLVLL